MALFVIWLTNLFWVGTQSLPVDPRANWTGPLNPQPPLQNTPPAAPAPAPAPAQKSSDPSSREVLGALKAREMNDARIGKFFNP